MQQIVSFPSGEVKLMFQSSINELAGMYDADDLVFIINEHIARLYPWYFNNHKTIVIHAGEHTKDIETIANLAKDLIKLEITRRSVLVGVGGGVITDITGFLASVYMRGIKFGFVPTTLLGMVDAAIGGKNGVNLDLNKNILGTFCHPGFIIYDTGFLKTLPGSEWSNGFAEIIKYACCFDTDLYDELSKNYISYYKEDETQIIELIRKCVAIKTAIVLEDEKETGKRRLLNFGHTVGHAIESLYGIPHGYSVAIGMVIACRISEKITGLDTQVAEKLQVLLQQYYLPTQYSIDPAKVMNILKMDKKRNYEKMDFILLEQIGRPVVHTLPFNIIESALQNYAGNN